MKIHLLTLFWLLTLPFAALSSEKEWSDWGDDWEETEQSKHTAIPVNGFLEVTGGHRTKDSVAASDWVSQDIRGRIESVYQSGSFNATYKGELYYDGVASEWHGVNREAYVGLPVGNSIDIRAGRQVLTWGTGDLVFLNDFFPKDWVAFFSGYDQQYLKAPSDAVKASLYSNAINVDLVWSPEFDPDNYINGEKLAYYSPFTGSVVAAPPKLSATKPGSSLGDGELALRLFKRIDSTEYAGYFYRGYYKTPEGFDPATALLYFPELSSLGGSVRTPLLCGITNIEYAYWHSRESDSGDNPWVPHSQSRFLTGYEQELMRNLTANFQYYVEYTHHYDKLKASAPDPATRPRKVRQLLTTRLTLATQQSNLVYSAFIFYSPSDRDYYLIPNVMYRMSDHLQFNGGANILGGKHDYTMFGQMETNSNVYLRAKYIF